MKVKHSVIPFIPFAAAALILKLMGVFGLNDEGTFLGMDSIGIAYSVIGIILALFLVCIVFNIIDRKTAPVYEVRKNFISGVLAIVSGIAAAASSFVTLIVDAPESEYYIMNLICAVLSIPAAIAFVLMAKVHFTGKSTVKSASVIYIFPSIWGCSELVSEFLTDTRVSISSSDMTGIFCCIFITLYFFSHSMIVSRVKGRNPVKACFIYGLPATASALTFGVYDICVAVRESSGISRIVLGAEYIVLALYILSFIMEMFGNCMTKDEVEIIESVSDEDFITTSSYDELAAFGDDDEKTAVDDDMSAANVYDDLIMDIGGDEEEEPIPYFTKEEMKNSEKFREMLITSDEPENYDNIITQRTAKKSEAEEAAYDVQSEKTIPEKEVSAEKQTADDGNDSKSYVKPVGREVRQKPEKKPVREEKAQVHKAKNTKQEKELSEIEQLLKELDDLK